MPTSLRVAPAIESGILRLYRQPIVDLSDDSVHGHELLLRILGRAGIRSGAALVREAELSGEIVELDSWVLERALEALSESDGGGGDARQLHVNLSGFSLIDPAMLEFLSEALDSSPANPALLTIEITETATIANSDRAQDFADRLGEFGCSIAIDDYGAGRSDAEYLETLPFDLLKIDASVIRSLDHGPARLASVVEIAQRIGVRTVAEGVEDGATRELVAELGVDLGQGFHLGRPESFSPGG